MVDNVGADESGSAGNKYVFHKVRKEQSLEGVVKSAIARMNRGDLSISFDY